MKLSYENEPWLKFVFTGEIKNAYEVFEKNKISYRIFKWIKLRHLTSVFGYYCVKYFYLRYRKSTIEREVNLSCEIVLFWMDADITGRYLITKILKSILFNNVFPVRAGIWFSHWLVFQGYYNYAEQIFTWLEGEKYIGPCEEKVKAELFSMKANYLFVRGQYDLSREYHKKSIFLCKKHDYTFFLIFNIGTWGRIAAMTGDLEEMSSIMSLYDDIKPDQPDERYGLRALIYLSFLYYIKNNIEQGDLFYQSAKNCYQKSNSPLDRSVFSIFECIIYILKNNIPNAIDSIRRSREELSRFGNYIYYSELIKLLELYLDGDKKFINQHILKNTRLHEGISNLIEVISGTNICNIQTLNDENNWFRKFFENNLASFEFIESMSIEELQSLVREITCTDDVSFKHIASGFDSYFNTLGTNQLSVWQFDVFCQNERYEIISSTNIKNWRNPGIFQSLELSLKTLQRISISHKLKYDLSENSEAIEIAKFAISIAHDIRSPLMTLKNIYSESQFNDQESLMAAMGCIERIQVMASELLVRNKNYQDSVVSSIDMVVSVKDLLFQIVLEKKHEISKNIKISLKVDHDIENCLIKVSPIIFKNIISNLINNSVDAIHGCGQIIIETKLIDNKAIILVHDDGKGMPDSLISQLFKEGVTFKNNGYGLGLFDARKKILNWNGNIEVKSELKLGTTVKISLPIFQNSLVRKVSCKSVHIIEDDLILGESIVRKLKSTRPFLKVKLITDPYDFFNIDARELEDTLVISDLNFKKSNITGVDVLKSGSTFKKVLMSGSHKSEILKNFNVDDIDLVIQKGSNSFLRELELLLN